MTDKTPRPVTIRLTAKTHKNLIRLRNHDQLNAPDGAKVTFDSVIAEMVEHAIKRKMK